jgi:hypothetical protein
MAEGTRMTGSEHGCRARVSQVIPDGGLIEGAADAVIRTVP